MKRPIWMSYGFAVLVVVATVLLKLAIAVTIEGETPFLLLFFAVLVSAWRGGVGPGLLATGLATLAADYFFIGPPHSFGFGSIGQAARLIQFVLEGAFTTFLVTALRSSSRRADERRAEIDAYQGDLEESEERYRLVIEGSNDGVWDWDVRGGGVYWNDRLYEILGVSRSEVEPSFDLFVDLLHPDDRQRTMDALMAHLERGEKYEVEFRWRHASGAYRVCLGRGKALRDASGAPVRMTGTVQDITERKQRENSQRFMSEASAVLASSLDYQKTLASVARLAVPVLADWCAVDVVEEDGTVSRLAVAHEDPEKVALAHELQKRYPQDPEAGYGVSRVLRTGEPELVPEIPESLISGAVRDEGQRELLRRLNLKSYIVVPLLARGRTLGAITLVMSDSGRRYAGEDLAAAEDLARRAALAVDNARLYREARREISDREKAERVLRQSEAMYRSVVDSAFDAVITMGADGIVRSFNKGAERVFGYVSEEVVGQPMTMLIPERFRETHSAGLRRYIETGEARIVGKDVLELPGLRRGGEEVSLELSITEVGESESPLFTGIARDITERKRAEQALRQSEERYRSVIEQAAEGIVLFDADDYRLLEANPEFLRMFGYDAEEVAGLTVYDIVSDDRENVDRNIEITLKEGSRVVGERRYRCRDGSLLDVMVSASPVHYGGRSAIGIVIRDISERKRTEMERSFLASIVDFTNDAVIGKTLEGYITSWNRGAERLYVYSAEEAVGKHITMLVPSERPDEIPEILARVREGETTDNFDTVRITKDGRRLDVSITVSPVRDSSGTIVAASTIARDITERKKTEEQLRRQADLLDLASEPIFAWEPEGGIVYWNRGCEDLYGFSTEEAIGRRSHELLQTVHPVRREQFESLLESEGRWFGELTHTTRDGRKLIVESRQMSTRTSDGRRLVLETNRDVTESKRAEEELRRSERSLADAQRIARMGNFEYDFQRDWARWSDELYRIFGWEVGEVAPRYKTFINAAHPEDRDLLRAAIREALRGAEGGAIEYRISRPGGEVRYVETQYEVRRRGTRPVELVGTVQDVTESRETERKLREAEARFRTLVEQIPAITYIQETSGAAVPKGVTYMSPQYESIFGYSPDAEMYDPEHWVKILHPDDRDRVLAEDERTDETGEPFKVEYRVYAKDGSLVWVRDEAVLVRDDQGRPLFWLGVQYDITDQKRIEQELEARAEELARSNAELERFAYIASHDLQEPLRMVSSYTQLLARRYKGRLDEDADEFIEYAVDGATRMQVLINDLLAYSRVGTKGKEFAPLDLAEIFEAARDNLRIAIEESGASVTSDPLPEVMGDSTQLVQLFQNLIGNAIKFRGEEPPEVHVGAERRGREWVISVRDNGIGIDPQYAERVFVIFQRLHTREDYAGTGIGLAVCKRIVERHGGRIWLESATGEGSTFFFTLPARGSNRR